MQTLHELFVHELEDMWAAEQELQHALEEMSRCATDQQLQQHFATHLEETRTHLDRLGQVFETLGIRPREVQCEGMTGIIREHDELLQQGRHDPQVHAVFDVGAAQRAENYEIAGYEELVRIAHALGYQRVANQLRANLIDERRQLSRLERAAMAMDLRGLAADGRQRIAEASGTGQPLARAGQQSQAGATPRHQPGGSGTRMQTDGGSRQRQRDEPDWQASPIAPP